MMLIYCDICNKKIHRVSSSTKRYGHNYCSPKCRGIGKTLFSLETRLCSFCRKPITRRRSAFRHELQFCDSECRARYFAWVKKLPKKELVCHNCGQKRQVSNQHFKTRKSDLCFGCSRKINVNKCINAMYLARQQRADFCMVECKNCGASLRLSKKQRSYYNLHFCNRKCRDKYYNTLIPIAECSECGKIFKRSLSNFKGKKQFCSQKCHYNSQHKKPIIAICEICEKRFIISRQELKRKKEGKRIDKYFCSKLCYYKYMIKDSPPEEIKSAARYLHIGYKEAKEKGYLPFLEIRELHKKLKKEILKNGN